MLVLLDFKKLKFCLAAAWLYDSCPAGFGQVRIAATLSKIHELSSWNRKKASSARAATTAHMPHRVLQIFAMFISSYIILDVILPCTEYGYAMISRKYKRSEA
jgi:hypothetical protein